MKAPFHFTILTLCVFLADAVGAPSFVKVGSVYTFSLAGISGQPGATHIASVLKDEGEGWLKISLVETKQELWINLAQVQTVVRINENADVLRASMQKSTALVRDSKLRSAILNNLRMIDAAVDQYRLESGKEPRSLDDIVGATKYVKSLNPIAGESYQALKLSGDGPLSVKTKDGLEVVHSRK
jgi:hypothetical protein